MTWLIVAEPDLDADPTGAREYLVKWDLTKASTDPDCFHFREGQKWAHRFADRNEAVRLANTWPIEAYCDGLKVIKLVPPLNVATMNRKAVVCGLTGGRHSWAASGTEPVRCSECGVAPEYISEGESK